MRSPSTWTSDEGIGDMSMKGAAPQTGLARELGQSIFLLALTGSSVGGFLGIVAIATRALGH